MLHINLGLLFLWSKQQSFCVDVVSHPKHLVCYNTDETAGDSYGSPLAIREVCFLSLGMQRSSSVQELRTSKRTGNGPEGRGIRFEHDL